jgi:hypothetical protein
MNQKALPKLLGPSFQTTSTINSLATKSRHRKQSLRRRKIISQKVSKQLKKKELRGKAGRLFLIVYYDSYI